MGVLDYITNSDSKIFSLINLILYRYIYNNLYNINVKIKDSRIISDSEIFIELKNGNKFIFTSYNELIPNNLSNKYKYSVESKIDKIVEYKKFFFIYDLIDEVYVKGQHFNKLNYNEYNTIFDIGANIGAFTVNAHRTNKKAKYIMLEPDTKNFNDLTQNIKLNKIIDYELFNKGVWNQNGKIAFFTSNRAGEHSIITNDDENYKKVEIDVCTLEYLFEDVDVKFPLLIKMDVEGAELDIINSSIEFLSNQKDITLLIEALHTVNDKPTYIDLVPLLRNAGFHVADINKKFRGTIFANK